MCTQWLWHGGGCFAAQADHTRCLIVIVDKIFSCWRNLILSTSATSWWRWRKSNMVSGKYQNATSWSRWRKSGMVSSKYQNATSWSRWRKSGMVSSKYQNAASWSRWRKSGMVSSKYQNAISSSRWRKSGMVSGKYQKQPHDQVEGNQIHHHHHHQSLNREGQWGTTDDFATSSLHFSLFSITLWDLPNSRPVHFLMLSSHLFLCLPRLLPPFTVPCKMVLARLD